METEPEADLLGGEATGGTTAGNLTRAERVAKRLAGLDPMDIPLPPGSMTAQLTGVRATLCGGRVLGAEFGGHELVIATFESGMEGGWGESCAAIGKKARWLGFFSHQLTWHPPSREAGTTSAGAICARGGGGGMAAVDYHQPCCGRWLHSLCSSHSRWLQWLCPSHLTQNGCDIASSAMRARPGAGGMAAAASFQPSLVRMAALCVSQPSGWRLWLHCS